MALNVKPIGDRILVEPAEEKETKKGGIIIPESAKEKPQESIVRALGTGKVTDDGKKVPFEVKVGDVHYYYLEDISLSGQTEKFSPILRKRVENAYLGKPGEPTPPGDTPPP